MGLDPYWAKSVQSGCSTGETLTEHLLATKSKVDQIRQRSGWTPVGIDDFWKIAEQAALMHDAGKISHNFQHVLGSPVGVDNGYKPGRHEVGSLAFVREVCKHLSSMQRLWVAAGIATHHRPLYAPERPSKSLLHLTGTPSFFGYQPNLDRLKQDFGNQMDPVAYAEMVKWLLGKEVKSEMKVVEDISGWLSKLSKEFSGLEAPTTQDSFQEGLAGLFLQGVVTYADHLASSHANLQMSSPLSSEVALQKFIPYDFQVEAAKTQGHLFIEAPTGSGKTEAALAWAETNFAKKEGINNLFYTLPYQASLNAMHSRMTSLWEGHDVGLLHSKASQHIARLASGSSNIDDLVKARKQEMDLLAPTVYATTIYQLFKMSLMGVANSKRLVAQANSLMIFDEIHAYEEKRFGWLLAHMWLWNQIGVDICMITATLPPTAVKAIERHTGIKFNHIKADPVLYNKKRHRPEVVYDDLMLHSDEIAERGCEESVLVVCNTIKRVQALKELIPDATLLHSRFKSVDRGRIEKEILEQHGVGTERTTGVVIATQVIEVSMDLDFDSGYFDSAPLDALLQRFGRVNRQGEREPALVKVFHDNPDEESKVNGIYDGQQVQLSVDILAESEIIDESQVNANLERIYQSEWGKRWEFLVSEAFDKYRRNFMDFTHPFDDREGLKELFRKEFDDASSIVLREDVMLCSELYEEKQWLEFESHFIPVSKGFLAKNSEAIMFNDDLKCFVADLVYSKEEGVLESAQSESSRNLTI